MKKPGFAHIQKVYHEHENPFKAGTYEVIKTAHKESSTALWIPEIPEDLFLEGLKAVVKVDEDGNIYGAKAGTATVTAKSTDGKFTKTFDVEVNYSVLQWIIIIVLFGWIWYI